jgi:hypothetical protein
LDLPIFANAPRDPEAEAREVWRSELLSSSLAVLAGPTLPMVAMPGNGEMQNSWCCPYFAVCPPTPNSQNVYYNHLQSLLWRLLWSRKKAIGVTSLRGRLRVWEYTGGASWA